MRKVAIIGAGQAGLIVAHTLLREGYHVDVYSDRTADDWLYRSKPTGTAYLFGSTIDIEKDLDIERWYDKDPRGGGALLHFVSEPGAQPLRVLGRTEREGQAADQRLKFHHWMNEFERRGGNLIIESVSAERLDEISADVDLTLIAAGKAEISGLIGRDHERSHFQEPPRRLAMVTVKAKTPWKDRIGFNPIAFNFIGGVGEYFWVPYLHKTAGPTWCGVVEAIPGGPMDRYGDCQSGEELLECIKGIAQDYSPWEADIVAGMEYVSEDPNAWMVGKFAPTVRKAFGRLPSGRVIMPVGDAAITFDPIGGQGGKCASRNAAFTAKKIIEHNDKPFDEDWMASLREEFWENDAQFAYMFNNSLLEPMRPAVLDLMTYAGENRDFAEQVFINNFLEPKKFFPWITDDDAIRGKIAAWK